MAVRMRLRREGKKKEPNYRIVVTDSRSPRDGRFLEDLGFYQPLADPSAIKLNHDRALEWLRHGAQPSDAVKNLLRIEGVWESFRPGDADAEAERRERRSQRRAEKAAARQPSGEAASPVVSEEPAAPEPAETAEEPTAAEQPAPDDAGGKTESGSEAETTGEADTTREADTTAEAQDTEGTQS